MGAIKGLRVVLGIILCLVLGASVWLTVQEQVLHQEETAVAGILLRPVEESSREPTLAWGDLAVVLPKEEYAMGETVLCTEEGKSLFLLLVGTNGDQFIAKEEAGGEGTERLLPKDAIRGKVVAALPGAGAVYLVLGSWWAAPVILVVGVLLLALPSLLGLGRPPREREKAPEKDRETEKRHSREKAGRYKGRHAR